MIAVHKVLGPLIPPWPSPGPPLGILEKRKLLSYSERNSRESVRLMVSNKSSQIRKEKCRETTPITNDAKKKKMNDDKKVNKMKIF